MYDALVTKGTDEKNEAALKEISNRYKQTIKKGTDALGLAKQVHDQLEQFYIDAVDFDIIEKIYVDLKTKIEELM